MGIVFKTESRPITPPCKTVEEEIPFMDGNLDFSEQNGRLYYQDKVLELNITVVHNSLKELNNKVSKIIGWLSGGYGDLIFDDMPNVKWIAKPVNVQGFAPKLTKVGKTTIQFRCKPFNKLIYDSMGVPLDSDIPLDSNIRIGFGDDNEFNLVSGVNNIVVNNIGNAPVRPVIEFDGSFSNVKIEFDNKTFQYTGVANYLIVDCEKFACFTNGADVTLNSIGDYPELQPGTNEIKITVTGNGKAYFIYNAQYFYGDVNFDDSDI